MGYSYTGGSYKSGSYEWGSIAFNGVIICTGCVYMEIEIRPKAEWSSEQTTNNG